MHTYEAVSTVYFLMLATGAPFLSAPAPRRVRGGILAMAAAAGVWSVSRLGGQVVREWAPLVYVAAAYWTPALLAPPSAGSHPGPARSSLTDFEVWLLRSDDCLRDRLP